MRLEVTKTRLTGFLLLAVAAMGIGCSKNADDRVEALGGGALSKVTTTILPSGGGGGGAAESGAAFTGGYGHLKGKVTIAGAVPSLGPLITESQVKPDDKEVCVVSKIPNEKLVVNGNAVKNVFVYLQKSPAGAKKPTEALPELLIDQKACTFFPHAMVVMVKQPIRIINSDALAHNVHLKPTRSGEYNNGIGANNTTGVTTSYANSERSPVRVLCDFHTWMSAWHLPLDHPYGAVTGDDGTFSIRDLPAGKHKFTIVHEGKALREVDVTIEPDAEAELNLDIPAGEFKLQ